MKWEALWFTLLPWAQSARAHTSSSLRVFPSRQTSSTAKLKVYSSFSIVFERLMCVRQAVLPHGYVWYPDLWLVRVRLSLHSKTKNGPRTFLSEIIYRYSFAQSKARKAAMIPMTRPMREEEISDGEPKRGLDHDFLIGGPKREKTTPQHERPSSASLPPHAHPVRMQQPRPKPTYDEPVSPHSAPLPRFAGVPEGYYETTDAPDGPLVPQAIPRVFAPPDAGDQSALVFSPMYPPIPTVAEAEKSSEDLTRSSNSVLRKLSMRQKLQSMPPRADGVFAPPVASVGEALTEMKSKELASSAMERPHESEEVEMSESISESETDEFDEEATSSFEKAS